MLQFSVGVRQGGVLTRTRRGHWFFSLSCCTGHMTQGKVLVALHCFQMGICFDVQGMRVEAVLQPSVPVEQDGLLTLTKRGQCFFFVLLHMMHAARQSFCRFALIATEPLLLYRTWEWRLGCSPACLWSRVAC